MKTTFGAAAVGLALLICGRWFDVEALTRVGSFILPLSFLYGGFFKAEQSTVLKITLIVIGGVLLLATAQTLNFTGMNFGPLFGR